MFNKDKFKNLIEKAKGDRSISQYSRESDVSRTYISQSINKTLDSPPNPDILRRLANKAKNGVEYKDLMSAAGYLKDVIFENKLPPNSIPVNEDTTTLIPVLGTVACGQPLLAEENIIGYRLVLKKSINGGAYFFLQAEGDSMINAGIIPGSYILVRKQEEVENGEIAVVAFMNGCEAEATVKRIHKTDGKLVLQPESPNPVHKVEIIDSGKVEVIGKVVGVQTDL